MRVRKLIQIILLVLLGYLLIWRWQVSQTRFFDVDEFSYLHWTAELVKGQRPYVDFFMFFGPGFLWFFAPIVKAYWMSAGVFLAARVMAFGIFLGILGGLGVLFGKTRGWKWALLPVVLLAFLPMPYDKFLEVRPDNLAVLIGLIGLIGQIGWLQSGKKQWAWWSGVFYSASLLVFVKTMPFVVVGCVVALLVRDGRKEFFLGLVAPLVLFFFWLLTLGDFGAVWYSLTKLPFEANMMGKFDIMEPHLFFFPNASFYGGWGVTAGLLTNHALWILGIVMGAIRLFTPYVTVQGDRKKMLVELLIGGTFVVLVYGYVQFFPLKHSQYLIPIAIFISYYAGDAVSLFFRRVERYARGWLALVVLLLGVGLIRINAQVNTPKLSVSNAIQIDEMKKLIAIVPQDARVLDMEGRMLFWPDAYYICCVPFGSFTRFMSRKPPVLSEVPQGSRASYIFQGDSNRLASLSPRDQAYIETHYERMPGWGERLWKRK